jgi:hypothetical protein
MADLKISQLDAVGSAAGTDTYPVVSGGITKKETVTQMFTLLGTTGLTTSGAWTFAKAAGLLTLQSTTATNALYFDLVNTGRAYLGMEGSAGAELLAGTPAYAGVWNIVGAYSLALGTTDAIRFLIDPAGIVSMANQSRARAFINSATQYIPNAVSTKVLLDGESWDSQGEMNTITVTGTAEENGGVNLKDTGIFTQAAGYYTIMWAWNTTDNTYTTITGKTNDDVLTLAANIFTVGETYTLYASRFVATKAGYYHFDGALCLQATANETVFDIEVYLNGTSTSKYYIQTSGGGDNIVNISDMVYMTAGQYLELYTFQNSGSARNILGGTANSFLAIHKLS